MAYRKLAVGVVVVSLSLGGGGAAVGATRKAPKNTTIKESQTIKVKANRYIQDGLRWDKDVYTVRSGGKLHVRYNVKTEGPHTFTVVRKKDLPRTAKQNFNCKICTKLGAAHGADPNSEEPPQFVYLENGTGQNTPPNVDRPGDSAGVGFAPGRVNLKVTAPKGTTLRFMCLLHPWMQARVEVG